MDNTLQQAVLAAVTDVLNDHQENGALANLSVTQLQDLAALFQESGFSIYSCQRRWVEPN